MAKSVAAKSAANQSEKTANTAISAIANLPTDINSTDVLAMFGDGAKAMQFAEERLSIYRSSIPGLHIAVCLAFYHAAQHGDVRILNKLYGDVEDTEGRKSGLMGSDRAALRRWVGEYGVSEEVETADGQEITIQREWIGFRSKPGQDAKGNILPAGFFVKRGMESARKDKYNPEDVLRLPVFNAKEPPAPQVITLKTVVNFLAGVQKSLEDRVAKAADQFDVDIHVPADLLAKVKELNVIATKYKEDITKQMN